MNGGFERVDTCNLCGSRQTRLDEEYLIENVVFEMRECASCGLAWVDPRPPQDEMAQWYASFSHPDWSQSAAHRVATPLVRWFLDRARAANRDDHAGYLTRVMNVAERRAWRRLLARYHVEWADRPCHVLDVGCGNGVWMAAQRRWGFHCEGVEPDHDAAAKARGLGFKVWTGDLLGAGYAESSFEIVHFNHVLEHVHDPFLVLTEAVRVTKPGGRVVVVVPNHMGVHARAFRNVEDVPRHLYAFSAHVLSKYFERVGLGIEHLYSETPDVWALYGPMFHASGAFVKSGAVSEQSLGDFWLSSERREEFAKIAAYADSIGGGVQVVAVGKKPTRGARVAGQDSPPAGAGS